MKCSICNEEHEFLEPAFGRPDVIFAMPADAKKGRVTEGNDLCALRGEGGDPDRYFVRCTLPVRLLDGPGPLRWGLWAEVAQDDSVTIWDAWDDPDQHRIPAMPAKVANRIPGYPDTIDLPVSLKLTGRATRPELSLPRGTSHPFVRECLAGVSVHRVTQWLEVMTGGSAELPAASESGVVACAEHGPQPRAFVCQHIVESLRDRTPRGFWCAKDSGNPRPDAWCSDCNRRLEKTGGEWTGWAEELAGVTLICGACYDSAQALSLGSFRRFVRRLLRR